MSIEFNTLDQSILSTIRDMLGPSEDYEYFDSELIPHINSVFNRLKTLGIGPKDGFSITSDVETWGDFFSDTKVVNMVISYMFLKVKMIFDPPSNSIAADAFKQQISEFEWVGNVDAESID